MKWRKKELRPGCKGVFSRQATCRLFCAYLFAFLALLGSSFLTNRINASGANYCGLFTLLVGFGPFMAAILVVHGYITIREVLCQ